MLNGECRVLKTLAFSIQHSLGSLKELRNLFALAELDVRLLPIGPLSDETTLALHLAVRNRRAHRFDLGSQQLLDGALDVDLRRVRRDFEHQRPPVLAQERGLLGDQGAPNNVCLFHNTSPVNAECEMPKTIS